MSKKKENLNSIDQISSGSDKSDVSSSQAHRERGRRRRSVMKAQKTAIIVLCVCIILLILGLFVAKYFASIYTFEDLDGTEYDIKKKGGTYVLCDKSGHTLETVDEEKYFKTELGTLVEVDGETGDASIFAVVDTEDGESLGTSSRILMFKHTSQDNVQQVEVHNRYGSFTFYRNSDDKFCIKGSEAVPYTQTLFAALASAAGYPLTIQKIEDPIKDSEGKYTEYGLAATARLDSEGNSYDYTPIWYRLTDTSGNAYTVYVGDAIPSGAGYYVQLVGRDAVYIMNYSVDSSILNMYQEAPNAESVENVFDLPIERFVSPVINAPMSLNDYFDVTHFMLFKGRENIKIMMDEKNDSILDESGEPKVNPMVSFSFWDLDERTGTFYANTAYILEYPKGYYIDDTVVDTTLQSFYTMNFLGVVKLNYTDDDLKTYGLDEPEHLVYFEFQEIEHVILISKMTENGTYYVTSALYDIIVEVDRSQLPFLDYKLVDWIDSSYFKMNLAWGTKITLESGDTVYTFELDNSLSDSVTNPTCSADAKKKGTISSDMMRIKCYDNKGNTMQALSKLIVKDTAGYVWTIDGEKIRAVNAKGESVSIKNGRYAVNAIGDIVEVLEEGKGIDCGKGVVVGVTANWITINDNGIMTKYLRYGANMFRKFYQAMLYASIEGDVHDGDFGLTDEKIAEILKTPDENLQTKITIETSHKDTEYVFRFYKYSERRSMITVNGGMGEFYVLRSFTDKIAADALRVITGQKVEATSKG